MRKITSSVECRSSSAVAVCPSEFPESFYCKPCFLSPSKKIARGLEALVMWLREKGVWGLSLTGEERKEVDRWVGHYITSPESRGYSSRCAMEQEGELFLA